MKSEFLSSGAWVRYFCGNLKYYWEVTAGGEGIELAKITLLLPFLLFPETGTSVELLFDPCISTLRCQGVSTSSDPY